MDLIRSMSFVVLICLAVQATCQILQPGDNGILESDSSDIAEDTCDNSDYETLKGRLLQNYDTFEELYRLPTFAAASPLPKHTRTNESFYSATRQECLHLQGQANSQGGLTCPSQVILNRDVNRVPCVVKEYKCLCRQCLIPHSLQSRRMNNGCEPIRHYIPVMRRMVDLNGEGDEWSYVLEPFSVGCSCTQRRHVFSSRS